MQGSPFQCFISGVLGRRQWGCHLSAQSSSEGSSLEACAWKAGAGVAAAEQIIRICFCQWTLYRAAVLVTWVLTAAACASSAAHGASLALPALHHPLPSLLFTIPCSPSSSPSPALPPLQLLPVVVPTESRSRNVLLAVAQSFLFRCSWLHERSEMQRKVSGERYDVKCPTILKMYY